MAHYKSLFLLLAITCVNSIFAQNAIAKEFELKYFSKATWFNAHLSCLQCGGQLASIESAEEQKYVEDLIIGLGLQTNHFWIAGTDLAIDGFFNWHTTGNPIRYKNFAKGQPDNYRGEEHCILLSAGTLQWNDTGCNSPNYFICEKKPKSC